jgi:class 3 adenylate cyclase
MLFRIMLKDMNPSIQGVRRTSAWLSIAESSRTSREFRKVARQPTSAGGHPVKTRLDGRLIRRTVPCGLDLRAMLQEPSGRIERRLSAILADDVAGYSRFMHRDEEPAHAKLTALLSDAVAPAIAKHGGRIPKNTGEMLLAELPPAVEAVRAAIDFARGANQLRSPAIKVKHLFSQPALSGLRSRRAG